VGPEPIGEKENKEPIGGKEGRESLADGAEQIALPSRFLFPISFSFSNQTKLC
jgi:hypothetical protein